MTFCSSRMFPGQGYDWSNLQGPFVDAPDVLASFARIAIDEVFNEQGNIRPLQDCELL
jgi:hypothetical protein